MGSTLRVLPQSCCACAGVYPSSMARSIIHRLVRPGILLVIINLEWNKTSSADSPEDFITGIKTFGLMWTSWTPAFRVPIPLVFGTSLTVHGHYTQGYGRDSESTTGVARCIAYTASSIIVHTQDCPRPRRIAAYGDRRGYSEQ